MWWPQILQQPTILEAEVTEHPEYLGDIDGEVLKRNLTNVNQNHSSIANIPTRRFLASANLTPAGRVRVVLEEDVPPEELVHISVPMTRRQQQLWTKALALIRSKHGPVSEDDAFVLVMKYCLEKHRADER
jgi:hypothetical protein